MSPLKACAAAFLALATGPLAGLSPFARTVPLDLPHFQGWERISGDVQLESPRMSVQYEFFVNPARPAIYEVVRYRIVELDFTEARRYPTTEKLQWDRDGRDVRRFECAGEPGQACAWREMAKGGDDYTREIPVLIWLYGLHNGISRDQARGPEATHLASPRRIVLTRVSG